MRLGMFLWRCFLAYRLACSDGAEVSYFALERYGVPGLVVLVAHGRSAWRVSDFAIRYFDRLQ